MRVKARTLSGPARLFMVVVVGWIAVWGGIYAYGTMTAAKAQQDGSEALREMARYTVNGNAESERLMGQAVNGYFDRRDRANDLGDLAKMLGPAGLGVIIILSAAGWWVYGGFRNSAVKIG